MVWLYRKAWIADRRRVLVRRLLIPAFLLGFGFTTEYVLLQPGTDVPLESRVFVRHFSSPQRNIQCLAKPRAMVSLCVPLTHLRHRAIRRRELEQKARTPQDSVPRRLRRSEHHECVDAQASLSSTPLKVRQVGCVTYSPFIHRSKRETQRSVAVT